MEPRTLFIDDQDLAGTHRVTRVIHPGRKHARNPVLRAEAPWEEAVICGGTVRCEAGGYRMWYQSYGRGTYINLYATSTDGVSWHRPRLQQYPDFEGSLDNNIFLSRLGLRSSQRGPVPVNQDHNPSVLYTPHQGEERAYTLFSYDYGRSGYSEYDGYFAAYSRDGVTWTDGPLHPVIPAHADVGMFTWDDLQPCFRAVVKSFLNIRGHSRRSVFATHSADGLAWNLPQPALIPDLEDDAWAQAARVEGGHTQFYGMPIFRYESVLLGFLQVFQVTDTVNPSHDGPVHVQLACSRDGRTWQRVGDRRPIVERGAPGTWDAGGVYSGNSLVRDGDLVQLYYTGDRATHGGTDNACAVGQVWWPRDRLVGLAAGPEGGTIELRPQLARGRLHLNADAERGQVAVELAGTGQRLPVRGDALDHPLPIPVGCQGQPIPIRLHLRDAEVFSLWWEG
jgi:hypothetical protein